MQEIGYRLSFQGIKLDDYLRMTNSDANVFREQYRDEALNRVKTQLAMEALQKAESVEATDEDVASEINDMAQKGARSVDDIRKNLRDRDYEYIRDTIINRKIINILKENAKIKTKETKKKAKKENSKSEGEAK